MVVPTDRCGFVFDEGNNNASCCWRETWAGDEYCVWHATKQDKPSEILEDDRTVYYELLDGAYLPGTHPDSVALANSSLRGSNLSNSNLANIVLLDINLQNSDLRWANLSGAVLDNSNLRNTEFQETKLSGASLDSTDLGGSNFRNSNLSDSYLVESNLEGSILEFINFRGAIISKSIFIDCFIEKCDFSNTKMIDADLSNSRIIQTNFSNADLRRVSLVDTDLTNSDFSGANLREANLTDANLQGVDLTNADLSGADLSGANLEDADLSGASLDNVDLTNTWLYRTKFSKTQVTAQTKLPLPSKIDQDPQDPDKWVHIYHQLSVLLEENGLSTKASRARILKRRYEGISSRNKGDQVRYMKYNLYRIFTLYNESPVRVLFWSVFTIVGFAVLYPLSGGLLRNERLIKYSFNMGINDILVEFFTSLEYSIIVFSLGGVTTTQPVGLINRSLVALESVLGMVLLSLFIVTILNNEGSR